MAAANRESQTDSDLQHLQLRSGHGHYYLNRGSAKFTDPTLGTFATTPRSICCGPGENQWDITVSKRIALTESKYFQFRADIFNLFNKTQFVNPDGNF